MAITVRQLSIPSEALVLLLAGLLMPLTVSGQEPIVPLQLSFSDPGARSMGFGGAFVALADDATAAFANPAGLVQLLKPEVSIEGRYWSYSMPYTEGGRLEGQPSGFGIDTTDGLRTVNSDDNQTGLSFISLAFPQDRWSFAVYRREVANLEFFSETQGLFRGGTNCCQIREYDQRATSGLDFVSYGLSAAFRVSDKFNVGLGMAHDDVFLESHVTVFQPDDDSLDSIFGPNSYLPENSLLSQRIYVDDTDWVVTAGLLWRLSDSWSLGAVYRQGPKIGIAAEVTAGQAFGMGIPAGEVLAEESGIGLEFPAVFGFGLAYRAADGRLTLSFQWDRVEYSSIPHSLGEDDVTIDDASELHLGAEYAFLQATPIIAVRVGAWFEPDHQMRATNDDILMRALSPPGDDEMHYTTGVGVAGQRFQIDLGVDFADRVDTTVSLSAIYSY